MKYYLFVCRSFLLLLFILLVSQGVNASPSDTSRQEIKAIEVTENNTFFGNSFYRVFYIGPYIIYQNNYRFDSTAQKFKLDSADNWIQDSIDQTWSGNRNCFFVFHRDSSFGFLFDPHRIKEDNRRMKVDTALKTIRGGNNFENLLELYPDSTSWNADRSELKELFIQRAADTPTVRLSFYYSKNLNYIQESLNPMMDKARKMKLYRIEFLIEEFHSIKTGRTWPPTKMITEMKEIGVPDATEAIQYVERYKNCIAPNSKTAR